MIDNCIFKAQFKMKDNILATYRDLVNLRLCSTYLCGQQNRVAIIIAANSNKQTDFIVRTLLHLGVSCGQISIDNQPFQANPDNRIRLLVTPIDSNKAQ